MTDLDLLFHQDSLYPHPERLVTLLGSHDTSRFLNEGGATPEKLLLAFGILTTVRGTPVIYSGDEVGMLGGQDPDNRRDFPGGFPTLAGALSAFDKRTRTPAESFIHDHVEELLTVRRASSDLSGGDQQQLEAGPNTLAYARGADISKPCTKDRGRTVMLINKGVAPENIVLKAADSSLAQCRTMSVLLGEPYSVTFKDGRLEATVPAMNLLIVHLQ
jgi:glycosidase